MKTLLKFAGIVACVAALGLNLQYAMDGYGIKSGKPYLLAFAAASASGSASGNVPNSSSSSAAPIGYDKIMGDCSVTLSGVANTKITVFGFTYTLPISGSLTLNFRDVSIDCHYGGSSVSCTDLSCADFWRGSGV